MLNVSDFNITGRAIPQGIADKIVKHHLIPLWGVEEELPFKIFVSQKSGYRPHWYEIKKGRPGDSQHCFLMKGAVDLSCEDFINNKDLLLNALVSLTKYTRIAEYNSFFHLDYRNTDRWLYDKNWNKIRPL